MAIKDTTSSLRKLLAHITHDLEKADGGNKAASQRVRTGTVKLEKTAKLYRKESISSEKKTKGTKKTAKKPAHAKTASKTKAKTTKVKAKAKAKSHSSRPRALAFKKPTAKIPRKKGKSWMAKIF